MTCARDCRGKHGRRLGRCRERVQIGKAPVALARRSVDDGLAGLHDHGPGKECLQRDGGEPFDPWGHRACASCVFERVVDVVDEPEAHGERAELVQAVLEDGGGHFVTRDRRTECRGQAAQRARPHLGHRRMLGSGGRSGHGDARVGCSGWSYKDWRGIVYPAQMPARRWFSLYAEQFDTVEINNTFYRLPPVSTVEQWAEQAPPGFTYALKLGQFGSHRMKLRDAASWLPNHLDRAQRLGPALGPTLVQLPPRWKRNVERLDEFLTVAPASMRWAVELRDATWLHDDTFEVLRRHGAALCIHDLLANHPWELTTDWTYVRFHGPDALERKYYGLYGGRRLWRPARRLQAWLGEGVDVYAYFNNDWYGHAVDDARWLRRRLAQP